MSGSTAARMKISPSRFTAAAFVKAIVVWACGSCNRYIADMQKNVLQHNSFLKSCFKFLKKAERLSCLPKGRALNQRRAFRRGINLIDQTNKTFDQTGVSAFYGVFFCFQNSFKA